MTSQSATIGSGAATGNVLNINGGTVSSALTVTIGTSGSGFNQVTITNGNLSSSSTVILGNLTSNNTVTVLANGVWNLNNQTFYMGGNGGAGVVSTGNVLMV